MNKQEERVLTHLIRPLEKIYGPLDKLLIPYYVEDFGWFSDDSLKEMVLDVRRSHSEKHFPLIADIYNICGLNDVSFIGEKEYQKQLRQEWLDKNFPKDTDIKQSA